MLFVCLGEQGEGRGGSSPVALRSGAPGGGAGSAAGRGGGRCRGSGAGGAVPAGGAAVRPDLVTADRGWLCLLGEGRSGV